MTRDQDRKTPRGFGAAQPCLDSLRPKDVPAFVVPRDLVAHGPHLLWPQGSGFRSILIERFPEALGSPEAWLAEAASRLAPGGRLLVSVENSSAARSFRRALEGKPAALDPHGAPGQHEIAFEPMRLLRALSAANLVVSDLLGAPSWNDGMPDGFVAALLDQSLLASRFVWGAPPARLWCVAEKVQRRAVSALVSVTGSTDPILLARTLESLAAACPVAEIVIGEQGDLDVDSWNEALTRSTGSWIWCVRAGDRPVPGDFEALAARVEFAPVCPVRDAGETTGELGGLLVQREVLFTVGPFPSEWESECIAGEEWFLRAELLGFRVESVRCGYRGIPSSIGPLQVEGERLVQRYSAFLDGAGVGHGGTTPGRAAAIARAAPWEGRAPTITLCMMARDEERFLPACLESARGAADEIILVDTGSKDRTVELAEGFGARVIRTTWQDDFAAPRNLGLAAATSDWILVLDADEVLQDDAVAKIREAVQDPEVSGWHFTFRNDHESEGSHGILMVRLYRNLPGLCYVNRIHEQVVPSLLALGESLRLRLAIAPVLVLHKGYSIAVMSDRRKNERNLRLFRMQLEEHEDDVYSLYKYGDFLRRIEGNDDEVLSVLTRTHELLLRQPPAGLREAPFAGEAAALLGLELAKCGRDREAAWVLDTALATFMPTPDLHYVAAGLCMKSGRPAEAAEHYRRCLAFRDAPLVVPVQEGVTGYVGLTGLAAALMDLGESPRAEVLLRAVMAERPDHEAAALTLSSLLLSAGKTRAALDPLIACLEAKPDGGLARYQGALLLLRLGMPAQAAGWAERALASCKLPAAETNRLLAEARLYSGDIAGARSAFDAGAAVGDEVCLIGRFFTRSLSGIACEPPPSVAEKRVREVIAKWTKWMEAAGNAPMAPAKSGEQMLLRT